MKKPAIASETTAGLCSGLFFFPEQILGHQSDGRDCEKNYYKSHIYIIQQKKIKIKP
jgi:hypothetical protein